MGLIYCESLSKIGIDLKVHNIKDYVLNRHVITKDTDRQILLNTDLVIVTDMPMLNRDFMSQHKGLPDIWHRSSSMNRITELCRYMGMPTIICIEDLKSDLLDKDIYALKRHHRYSITDNTYMTDLIELPSLLEELNMSTKTHNILVIAGGYFSVKMEDIWDLLA